MAEYFTRDRAGNVVLGEPTGKSMQFWYTVPVVASLGVGASASSNISFDADSTFTWTHTTYFVDLSGAAMTDSARPIPLINVFLTDTGTGRNFMNTTIAIDTFAAYKGSEPYPLTYPRVFAPNSTLRCAYVNYSAASTYTNIYLVLHGVKRFLQG